jgi:hypothetical protein
MTNTTWVIPQNSMVTALALDGLTDVVVQVNAYRQISDGSTFTQLPVCIGLTPPTEGFVPYAELTQEIVEGWLNQGADVAALDAELATMLDNILNPKTSVLPNPF